MVFEELDHPVTISCGIASHDLHAGSVHALIAPADEALDRAKKQGRNRVAVADEEVVAAA
jgi:PleD family two-component response regulator